MNLRKQLACWSLLLLMTLIFEAPSFADGYGGRFNKFKPGSSSSSSSSPSSSPSSSSEFSHVKQKQGHGFFSFNRGGNSAEQDDNGDDELFGADKRKIYTGPNPLHNR